MNKKTFGSMLLISLLMMSTLSIMINPVSAGYWVVQNNDPDFWDDPSGSWEEAFYNYLEGDDTSVNYEWDFGTVYKWEQGFNYVGDARLEQGYNLWGEQGNAFDTIGDLADGVQVHVASSVAVDIEDYPENFCHRYVYVSAWAYLENIPWTYTSHWVEMRFMVWAMPAPWSDYRQYYYWYDTTTEEYWYVQYNFFTGQADEELTYLEFDIDEAFEAWLSNYNLSYEDTGAVGIVGLTIGNYFSDSTILWTQWINSVWDYVKLEWWQS